MSDSSPRFKVWRGFAIPFLAVAAGLALAALACFLVADDKRVAAYNADVAGGAESMLNVISGVDAPSPGQELRDAAHRWQVATWLLAAGAVGLVALSRSRFATGNAHSPAGERAQPVQTASTALVPCPYCAELIQPAAVLCRFCQRTLSTAAHDT